MMEKRLNVMPAEKNKLIRKYNVPGPRYTSYPTVPYWDTESFTPSKWELKVKENFGTEQQELSLYIHLPYCESLCTFCGCNTRITVNHAVERPYIDAVLKEWNLYKSLMTVKPVIKEIHLGGGTPTFFSPENLRLLIQGLKEGFEVPKSAEVGFEGHPGNTTPEHMQALYDEGFRRISFGIQDFDEKIQEVINRHQSFDQVKVVVDQARKIGYTSINFDLVYGLPLQTVTSIEDTMSKINALRPDRIAFYSYAHVPWVKPGQRKFTELDLPDDETKRALYEVGRERLEGAGFVEIGMDHFALPNDSLYTAVKKKKLHRNFMGYTPRHTQYSIGLGVSAISDLWEAYAQNVKSVEGYIAHIEKGVIPVYRGHLLNSEDLILRQHILNLMCKFHTSWKKPDALCVALFDGIERLQELKKDGLVDIGFYSMKITRKGMPFIRNLCMALDARMWRSEGEEKKRLFSKVI